MSEKYIVDFNSNDDKANFMINIKESRKCIGEIYNVVDAEKIIRLLNENESSIKLSEDDLYFALNSFEDDLNYYNGRKTLDKDIPTLNRLIKFFKKAIEQLPQDFY